MVYHIWMSKSGILHGYSGWGKEKNVTQHDDCAKGVTKLHTRWSDSCSHLKQASELANSYKRSAVYTHLITTVHKRRPQCDVLRFVTWSLMSDRTVHGQQKEQVQRYTVG